MLLRSLGCIRSISPGPALHLYTNHKISLQIIFLSIEVSRCDQIFKRVSRFQCGTKYSLKYQGFDVGPNIHSSIKVSMWYQIFNRVSRFQSGTKYSFKLECRIVSIIAGIIVSIIAGIIVSTTIVRVQASKYGCHRMVTHTTQTSLPPLGSCHVYIHAVQSSIQYFQVYSIDQDIHLDHTWVYIQPMDWLQDAVHGATLTASMATHNLSLMTQITEAYHNSSTIPIGKWSITFGISLTLQLEQTTVTMEAWLLQYQAGQKHLANILTQEHHKQGTITRFLISHTKQPN